MVPSKQLSVNSTGCSVAAHTDTDSAGSWRRLTPSCDLVIGRVAAGSRASMTLQEYSSTRAAPIYQHASRDRERAIAVAACARVEAVRPKVEGHDRGTSTETAPKRA